MKIPHLYATKTQNSPILSSLKEKKGKLNMVISVWYLKSSSMDLDNSITDWSDIKTLTAISPKDLLQIGQT